MRAFFIIFIAAVLALFVNAAAVEKRAVSTAAALCIYDLNSVGEQLVLVQTKIDELSLTNDGYSRLRIFRTRLTDLGSRIVKATTDCNAIAGLTNVEDTTAILANVGTLVPKFTSALNSISNKRDDFVLDFAITNLVRNDIDSLDTKTTALNAVLIAKFPTIPQNYLKTLKGYVTQIDAEFTAVKEKYVHLPGFAGP